MNTFKRKALFAAVLAGLGAGIAYATPPPSTAYPTAYTYPFYTLQADASAPTVFHEYVSVVNRSGQAALMGSLAGCGHGRHAAGFIRYRWESNAGSAPSATS